LKTPPESASRPGDEPADLRPQLGPEQPADKPPVHALAPEGPAPVLAAEKPLVQAPAQEGPAPVLAAEKPLVQVPAPGGPAPMLAAKIPPVEPLAPEGPAPVLAAKKPLVQAPAPVLAADGPPVQPPAPDPRAPEESALEPSPVPEALRLKVHRPSPADEPGSEEGTCEQNSLPRSKLPAPVEPAPPPKLFKFQADRWLVRGPAAEWLPSPERAAAERQPPTLKLHRPGSNAEHAQPPVSAAPTPASEAGSDEGGPEQNPLGPAEETPPPGPEPPTPPEENKPELFQFCNEAVIRLTRIAALGSPPVRNAVMQCGWGCNASALGDPSCLSVPITCLIGCGTKEARPVLWGDVLGRPDESFGAVKPIGAVQENGRLPPFEIASQLISRRTASRGGRADSIGACATTSDLFAAVARAAHLPDSAGRPGKVWLDATVLRRTKGRIAQCPLTAKALTESGISDICVRCAFAWIVESMSVRGTADSTVANLILSQATTDVILPG
jgi:hypothetical protein